MNVITIRVTADLKDDRNVTVTLPPEVPTGPVALVVNVIALSETVPRERPPGLADWAAEDVPAKYLLRGSVLRYDDPFGPAVDASEWEAMQ